MNCYDKKCFKRPKAYCLWLGPQVSRQESSSKRSLPWTVKYVKVGSLFSTACENAGTLAAWLNSTGSSSRLALGPWLYRSPCQRDLLRTPLTQSEQHEKQEQVQRGWSRLVRRDRNVCASQRVPNPGTLTPKPYLTPPPPPKP